MKNKTTNDCMKFTYKVPNGNVGGRECCFCAM